MAQSFFDELNSMFSATSLETRGENAHGVAVRFLSLLAEQVPEEDERRKLMNAWVKSVRDKDYRKFKRALRKYKRHRDEKELSGE